MQNIADDISKKEIVQQVFEKRSEIYEGLEYIKAGDTYPYPWLHDSVCIAGWGIASTDPLRAMNQIRFTLEYAFWNSEYAIKKGLDGFPAHIVFTKENARYFPNENIYKTYRFLKKFPTSGITQLPFLASAVLSIYEKAIQYGYEKEGIQFIIETYPRIKQSYEVLKKTRDPLNEGLLSIFCPWEDGMDNSPRHDEPLYGFPEEIINNEFPNLKDKIPEMRRDIRNEDGSINPHKVRERPTNQFYIRVISIIEKMKLLDYDQQKIYDEGYFNVKNVAFTSVFAKSCLALSKIASFMSNSSSELKDKYEEDIRKWTLWYDQIKDSLNTYCFDTDAGMYYDINVADLSNKKALSVRDALSLNKIIKRNTVAGFFPIYAGVPDREQLNRLVGNLGNKESFGVINSEDSFLLPSLAINDPAFDPLNYWRGPAWIVTNWVVAIGLEEYGLEELASKLYNGCMEPLNQGIVVEHLNPLTAEPGGNTNFPWSGAFMNWLLYR